MKKFELKFWLSCMMIALCIGFTACSDDDDEGIAGDAKTLIGARDMKYTKARETNGTKPIPKMCIPLRMTVAEHIKMYQKAALIQKISPGAFPVTS